jgi:hypothetical protein
VQFSSKIMKPLVGPIACSAKEENIVLVVNLNNAAAIEQRKQMMAVIIAELGRKPSCRQMANLLEARGVHISHVQVSKYYHQMHLSLPEPPRLLLPSERLTL